MMNILQFKYYLKKTYYEEVEAQYNEYQKNYTNELEYYGYIFVTDFQCIDINNFDYYIQNYNNYLYQKKYKYQLMKIEY